MITIMYRHRGEVYSLTCASETEAYNTVNVMRQRKWHAWIV